MNFKEIRLPNKNVNYIPEDIELIFPKSDLPQDLARYLAYIPWSEKYLSCVPVRYRDFFKVVLPHLHARTTDVHTAVCLPLLQKLIDQTIEPINQRLIFIALILHDSGWSKCSDKEIADSLSYAGAKPTSEAAKAPKNKHAELGSELAGHILKSFQFEPPLSEHDIQLVKQMVRCHDVTDRMLGTDIINPDLLLVSDADRLWSFTHENFWQDTIRKQVPPDQYLQNLSSDIEQGYFYTKQGAILAGKLLEERSKEVARWPGLH
jgi:hypothetical protein